MQLSLKIFFIHALHFMYWTAGVLGRDLQELHFDHHRGIDRTEQLGITL